MGRSFGIVVLYSNSLWSSLAAKSSVSDSVSSVCGWASGRAASGTGLVLLLALCWLVAAATCGCGCSALVTLWLEAIVVKFCIVRGGAALNKYETIQRSHGEHGQAGSRRRGQRQEQD